MLTSIKGKLILWLSIVLAFFLAGSAWYLHNRLDGIVLRSIDNLLHSKSQLIQGLIEVDELHIEIELSEVAEGEYALPRSGHYYRILNWNAKEIVRSPSLEDSTAYPEVQLPLSESERFDTMDIGPAGEPVRWVTSVFKIESGLLVVQAGDRLTEAYGLVHEFGRVLLLAAPFGLLILLGGA
ncbi:MAG: sensor histidine kinase N-terminal domain-containing protein, partial [Nitrospirota bacterium]|nr:sensor histidine kinase N-terminal domain-containing protein [Nitrospirota bacterium]